MVKFRILGIFDKMMIFGALFMFLLKKKRKKAQITLAIVFLNLQNTKCYIRSVLGWFGNTFAPIYPQKLDFGLKSHLNAIGLSMIDAKMNIRTFCFIPISRKTDFRSPYSWKSGKYTFPPKAAKFQLFDLGRQVKMYWK